MKLKEYLAVVMVLFLAGVTSYVIVTAGAFGCFVDLRPLARHYLESAIVDVRSPQVVAAVLWDYRGLDTLFETAVFFLAIIGSIAVFRLTETQEKEAAKFETVQKMSFIVRDVTKIIVVLIASISAAIALHGHLTPGGGFQGGAILAIVPILIIVAFTKQPFVQKGYNKRRAVIIRCLSLTGIMTTVLLPVVLGGYVMQNQPVFPVYIAGQLVSGSLIWFNVFEYLAVGAGFTIIFLMLSYPENLYQAVVKGGKD